MPNIAVLGVGAMGSRIARNLLTAGYSVTVYNRSPERAIALKKYGATVATTPRAAAEGTDIVICMVRDNDASRAIWLAPETGALHALGTGSIAVESSTITPDWAKELAAHVQHHGADFVEAPVLGTRPQAEARQLIYLLGGDPAVIARVKDVLAATASAVHDTGAVGTGAAMKLAVNVQYGVQIAIWAEMLAFLNKHGILPAQAVELLTTLPTTSPALQVGGRLMAARNYAPLFPIELVEKDFGYALDVARSLGVHTPTLDAVHAVYANANTRGYGGDNIVGVQQLIDTP